MFIKEIGTIDKDVIFNSKPKFEEQQLYYYRREEDGYVSFVVKNGKTQELMMNGSAWEILELCNGKRSILEIGECLKSRYGYLNGKFNFIKDVIVTVCMFDQIWLVSWGKGGSPFMINSKLELSKGSSLEWCKENRIREIEDTYEKFVGQTGYYQFNCLDNRFKGLSEYQNTTFLRSKLFFYKEDFFLLTNHNGEREGVISIRNDQPNTDVLEVSTILTPMDKVEELLKGAIRLIMDNYLFKLNKLRIKMISDDTRVEENILNAFGNVGFTNTAILKNEYGENSDLLYFDYLFEGSDKNE
ncbi:MAG: hypothetical protein LKI32_00050 [Lachnospiraceae bacterium]|jgi:hypothetical protein|nr:hypothetical protein [Lachnospiraceae bacterium]MCI1655937.1 hypothetical protein [Lachnospiraceae bacterium]MCI2194419.1 hypothetical protein [Lachnospiraceae bacterium]